MKYNRAKLINQFENNERIKYVFFWGHTPKSEDIVDKSCFSQWWLAPFKVNGITYFTAEHWMMAEKARLFEDFKCLEEIIEAKTPMQAKQWGRKVRGFIPAIWNQHKYEIVIQGNLHKFSQHKKLKEYLLNTQQRVLVEASPRDRIWGIGMSVNNENAENPILWRGENLLGFALMEVRDKLRIEK